MKCFFQVILWGLLVTVLMEIILAQTAKRLGFKVIVYATNEGSPTLADADVKIVGDFSDKAKLQDFY